MPAARFRPHLYQWAGDAAVRHERFEYRNPRVTQKTKFDSTDWKAGVRWQPIDELTLRATRSTDDVTAAVDTLSGLVEK